MQSDSSFGEYFVSIDKNDACIFIIREFSLSFKTSHNMYCINWKKEHWNLNSSLFQMLDIIIREETLLNVIRSVTRNGKSILLTTVLALILVYLFSVVGFLFLRGQFFVMFVTVLWLFSPFSCFYTVLVPSLVAVFSLSSRVIVCRSCQSFSQMFKFFFSNMFALTLCPIFISMNIRK